MPLNLVRVLGWLVIVHGLSHAVLPLRGSTAPALLINDWTPVGLYMIGMVGFVAAGLGMLGLRPFDRAISPMLVVASGLSLVAIVRFGDPNLWWGGAFDGMLLFIGLWRAYGGWPVHPTHGLAWHRVGIVTGFVFLAYVATATTLWPWHRTWGSTRAELSMALPGDRTPRNPALEIQRAITIDAPPSAVWPWLVQLGQDRAGLFGSRLGGEVGEVERERTMVLKNGEAFVLVPTDDGRTRFIIRSPTSRRDISVATAGFEFMVFELPHFVRERRMMLEIKTLAEQRVRLTAAARP